MPVYDESEKSGVQTNPVQIGGATAIGGVTVGGTVTGSLELDDLSDVSDADAQAYYTIYRRPDGTYGFRSYGFGQILGYYATEGELTTNHPTGQDGTGYVVGTDLYIWDSTQWRNVGPFVGPKGDPGVENIIVSDTEPAIPQDNSVTWVWLDTSGA